MSEAIKEVLAVPVVDGLPEVLGIAGPKEELEALDVKVAEEVLESIAEREEEPVDDGVELPVGNGVCVMLDVVEGELDNDALIEAELEGSGTHTGNGVKAYKYDVNDPIAMSPPGKTAGLELSGPSVVKLQRSCPSAEIA